MGFQAFMEQSNRNNSGNEENIVELFKNKIFEGNNYTNNLFKVETYTTPKYEENISIPDRYGIDYIYLLPINPQNIYIIWEITLATLKNTIADINNISDIQLLLRVFYDKNNFEEIAIKDIGNYYYSNNQINGRYVWAELGGIFNGSFIKILATNKVLMPRDYLSDKFSTYWINKESSDKIIYLSIFNLSEQHSSIELQRKIFQTLSSDLTNRG